MSFDAENLYKLLPEDYRVRDAKEGLPLAELLSIVAEQVGVIEEDLAQLYDDMFVETCAEWVVPYIGDLTGVRGVDLSGSVSQRAQVANTLAYRRRKGTLAVLEQLARDVTGWPTHAVEFFRVLSRTQNVNHAEPKGLHFPDLRQWEPLEHANGPFDGLARSVDVRRATSGRGRHNIPNVGIYLWRLRANPLRMSPPVRVDDRRYLFSPLGHDQMLFTKPEPDPDITHLAKPLNVPEPISRRVLHEYLDRYYGPDKSILVENDGQNVMSAPGQRVEEVISVADLSDLKDEDGDVTGWANMPEDTVAIDPVLGRLAFPPSEKLIPVNPRVTYRYGFAAEMGGGEYDRAASLSATPGPVRRVPQDPEEARPSYPSIRVALDALAASGTPDNGVVEISDNGRYEETLQIKAGKRSRIEVRAGNRLRPSVVLREDLEIEGEEDAEVTLNGLLISGHCLRVTGGVRSLRLRHCTLVPGLTLTRDGEPSSGAAPSLVIESENTSVEIDRCIVGGIRVPNASRARVTNSILDATDENNVAYAAPDEGPPPGGPLSIGNSTVIGNVQTRLIEAASNTIFLSPVTAQRRQEGCVRFCYLPLTSRVPRAYRCRPENADEATRMRPQFSSLRYADPGYCQLSSLCAAEIRQGADDEAEMGVFHDLYQPQRETILRVRLEEYLRFGLEAGIFYAS